MAKTSSNTLHQVRRLKGAASPKFAARKENSFEQKLCTSWCAPFSGQIKRQTSGATGTLYVMPCLSFSFGPPSVAGLIN
jgi:hypothetical protein